MKLHEQASASNPGSVVQLEQLTISQLEDSKKSNKFTKRRRNQVILMCRVN